MPATARADAAAMEASRYRKAAEETLDQLQWCINYLHSIRKRQLAEALAANHRAIRDRLNRIAEQ